MSLLASAIMFPLGSKTIELPQNSIDLSFLPSDMAQAEDRAYRIGQKNNVLVYYPLFDNTIEGIIYDIVQKKKNIISTVMGDGVVSEDNGNAASEILNKINNLR